LLQNARKFRHVSQERVGPLDSKPQQVGRACSLRHLFAIRREGRAHFYPGALFSGATRSANPSASAILPLREFIQNQSTGDPRIDRRRGFKPWLDSPDIGGGDSWTDEIERAIDGADVVLALLTPGSYASRICRAEQLRVLRKDKLVIPLLAKTASDIPLYLETANYRDFTGVVLYQTQFQILLEDLGKRRRGARLKAEYRSTYVTAPPLVLRGLRSVVLYTDLALNAVQLDYAQSAMRRGSLDNDPTGPWGFGCTARYNDNHKHPHEKAVGHIAGVAQMNKCTHETDKHKNNRERSMEPCPLCSSSDQTANRPIAKETTRTRVLERFARPQGESALSHQLGRSGPSTEKGWQIQY